MRVTHIIWSLEPREGGPPAALVGLVQAQCAAGMQVKVAATFRAEDVAAESAPQGASPKPDSSAAVSLSPPTSRYTTALRQAGAHVTLVGPVQGPLQRHPQLQSSVEQAIRDADIVHIHGVWEEINHLAARAAQQAGVPYIVRPCGMLDPWSLTQGKWKKRLYLAWRLKGDLNRAAALHFTTDSERDLTAPLHLRPPSIVEPNGVAWDEFAQLPPRGEFRAQYPTLGGAPMLLFLSRLHPKKGLDILLPALAQLSDTPAMLVIAGPDEDGYSAEVARMVSDLKLSERVVLTGPLYGRTRVAALSDADLFVLPSYQENFGIAVAESLAAGTPVVVSDQVALHTQVTQAGVGGVTPLDADALARELRRWLSDTDLRSSAAARTRPFARSQFDWNAIAGRWQGHYSHLRAPQRSAA